MHDHGACDVVEMSEQDGDKTPEELEFIAEQRLALANQDDEEDVPTVVALRSAIFLAGVPQSPGPLRPLAKAQGDRGHRRPKEEAPMVEPIDAHENFTTSEAARYCRFRTPGGLRKAWYSMFVFPYGRRGGRMTLMWRRSELDRFLRGEPRDMSDTKDILLPPKLSGDESEEG